MRLPQRMTDDEIDARASEIAAAALEDPLWRIPGRSGGTPPSPRRCPQSDPDGAGGHRRGCDPPRAGDSAMTSSRLPMEDLTLAEVAARLRKSARWLQSLLAEDKRRRPGEQRFHFHARHGRTPVWTEPQFQLLRAAVKAASAKERRRPAGLEIIERDGHWHIHGTIIAQGRRIRVRRSARVPATADTWEEADEERRRIEKESAANSPKVPAQVLKFHRCQSVPEPQAQTPLGQTSVKVVKEITAEFGLRRVGDILESEWSAFVDARHAGNTSETRERCLNAPCWVSSTGARRSPACGAPSPPSTVTRPPATRADAKSAPYGPLPSLIDFMLGHAAPHLGRHSSGQNGAPARASPRSRTAAGCAT